VHTTAHGVRQLCAILVLAAPAGAATSVDCVALGGPARVQLVELYTSEGCSSCPPADHWLSRLPASAGLARLSFHVDYWDDLGWPDRYADPRHAGRQSSQAVRDGHATVYTPEIVVDGREWRRWPTGLPDRADAPAPFALELSIRGDTRLELGLRPTDTDASPAADAYFVVTEDGLSSEVRAGENRGKRLEHDHVVRGYAGPLPLDEARVGIDLPTGLDRQRATVVAYAQARSTGEILQVVQQSLAACAGN
jgi:hypothetical protein